MGIVNVTPDSFSDGGAYPSAGAARDAALRMVADGADLLDVGGESTRPGAAPVSPEEQIRRVVPVIRAIRDAGCVVPVSVDTTSASVAGEAIRAGAGIVNDVSAATDDAEMLRVVARSGAGLILMHRAKPPSEDRYSDRYERAPMEGDVVAEVRAFLASRLAVAVASGVARERVALDPGLGFGKTVEQNLELIGRGMEVAALGRPVVSGISRKSFAGRVGLGRDSEPGERVWSSVGLAVAHALRGAHVHRVHDVRVHAEALRAAWGAFGFGMDGRASEAGRWGEA
ncbi:MAG: dihydropteroate synthase [Leptolyngbya sp. PLA1]|nr:dihydropteroate synthase [Leptolyngbya sp. PLA1]